MKKVLLAGTALVGFAVLASPAHAELKLDLGGYFSGYGVWTDNNEAPGAANSLREFDLRRDTEVHVSGETTLDNGLTVGFHTEQALGGATQTDEAYAYASGGWGRVNLGSEDGAAYLLQVAAPGADSNIDGLRTYIQALAPVTNQTTFYRSVGTGPGAYTQNTLTITALDGANAMLGTGGVVDYDHQSDPTATNTDRVSYLTPKFNGFQAGISYAPEAGQNAVGNNVAAPAGDQSTSAYYDKSAGIAAIVGAGGTQYEDIWEGAVRWDGEFQGFGLSAGVGFSSADIEGAAPIVAQAATNNGDFGITDGIDTWNAGGSVTWSGFSLGGSYMHTELGVSANIEDNSAGAIVVRSGDVERNTWVVGLGWDNGPWHVGGSYLDQETETPTFNNLAAAVTANDAFFTGVTNEVTKATVGGGYTFGPGMTFRGSVAWGEFEAGGFGGTSAAPVAAADNDFQQIAIGTEIDF